ncbi:9221_t:CDS:2 [Scutellospora calospora]|uniref:9221_t:CDS:1 n=1 Tax=Scutellospora calospora TaxID=85575 RepID=A0ACA9K1V3_9GLOM|nr:9221_t:CDS:2 [Scutellospora calospora]
MNKNINEIEKYLHEIEKNKNKWNQFSSYCLKQRIPMQDIGKFYDKDKNLEELISSLPQKYK